MLRYLKTSNPLLKIDFLVKEQFIQAIEFNKNIDNVVLYNTKTLNKLESDLKEKKYDLIIDLQNNIRSRLLTGKLNARIVRFKKRSFRKFLLVKTKINLLKNEPPIAARYIETFSKEKFDDSGLCPEIFYPDSYNVKYSWIKTEKLKWGKIIGICPGAKHFTKTYPAALMKLLISSIINEGYTVFLFGGTQEENVCKELSQAYPSVYNFQNSNNLYETAAAMLYCDLIITGDSALMHLANALNRTIISIFGSSVREFGFVPVGKKNILLENNQLTCRPCSHFGLNKCPKEHFRCMNEILPELILTKIKEIFRK